ncbi:polyisoprenoid-binding protein YceI [Agromyces flavus]|uniref:Polyisoprenoid-binding protein YceI n=1 Tax=Agromyces flavus TaxID=589382 RepID=A0A1H1ZA19_9MICO|nr:YceI family protein [Agromyces flavus]MCP2366994.1 polyisoprenoid-binding protein YceI [Agromyces flavus]GGI46612.1 polyisoprenoid-binding protein [Agromyces flavus]SDT30538.1 Polyisoprenoid-binding protein YceI [Agromyces flavus]
MTDNGPDLSGDWDLDPGHSRIGFSAKHAMVANVRGAFNDVTGTLHVDFDEPSKSYAEIALKVASIDSRNAQRDEHLRSADFFDAEKWPEITFRSTRIEEVGENALVVSGDLTIRDVTKPITIPIEFTGVETDAFGALRAGFEGTRRIDRREYGLEWNMALDSGGWLVSEKITLEFELSAIKRTDDASKAA